MPCELLECHVTSCLNLVSLLRTKCFVGLFIMPYPCFVYPSCPWPSHYICALSVSLVYLVMRERLLCLGWSRVYWSVPGDRWPPAPEWNSCGGAAASICLWLSSVSDTLPDFLQLPQHKLTVASPWLFQASLAQGLQSEDVLAWFLSY